MKKAGLILMVVFATLPARAEYRVYQYMVKARHPFSVDKNAHMVTSTLDPQSYLAYHGGSTTLSIDLMRTWMCKGDTSHKEYCESPHSKLNRELSSVAAQNKGVVNP